MGKPCSCTQYIKSRTFLLQVTRESASGTTSHVRIHYQVLQVMQESVIRYYKACENPYQVLQVMRTSGTSHVRCVWPCNEIEGSYDKIIILVPNYTGKNITRLLSLALLLVLCTHNNTDSNKLVIFSGIALYYGDTYILFSPCPLRAWVWSWYPTTSTLIFDKIEDIWLVKITSHDSSHLQTCKLPVQHQVCHEREF